MDEREIVYEEVGNYTKYALVEMLINKHKKSFNNLNICYSPRSANFILIKDLIDVFWVDSKALR